MKSKSPLRGKNRSEAGFRRAFLPNPTEYYRKQGVKLTGGGEWKNAVCPLHDDTRPSLRVHLGSGAFRCWACGKRGGDVLDFHRQRYELGFREAAIQLGAWEMEP